MAEGFMFAPQDSSPWEFSGKDDLHGLGYRGMEERGVLAPRKSTKALYGMRGEVIGAITCACIYCNYISVIQGM